MIPNKEEGPKALADRQWAVKVKKRRHMNKRDRDDQHLLEEGLERTKTKVRIAESLDHSMLIAHPLVSLWPKVQ